MRSIDGSQNPWVGYNNYKIMHRSESSEELLMISMDSLARESVTLTGIQNATVCDQGELAR